MILAGLYPWIKSFHIVAMVAWMAGLFYLPRLYVYHADAPAGSEQYTVFTVMERRLLRIIMNPAMIVTYLLGVVLALTPGIVDYGTAIWFYVKLAAVVVLTIFHHYLSRWRKDFALGQNRHSSRFYRRVNEIPTLALIVIVIMVVVKP